MTDRAYRPHDEIAQGLGILDTERAAKLSGSRFYVLKGDGVRLRLAMFQLYLDMVEGQGFELVSPPVLAKRFSLYASGYLPFAQSDNFALADSELSLTGTSEQALLAMHADEVLPELPVKYLGDSMCFRTEAGSHGRDVRGMMRVHQFYKLEQFLYCAPDEVEALHLQMLDNEVAFIDALNVPSQTIICSSGDVAAPGFFKYDVEAWFPATGTYPRADLEHQLDRLPDPAGRHPDPDRRQDGAPVHDLGDRFLRPAHRRAAGEQPARGRLGPGAGRAAALPRRPRRAAPGQLTVPREHRPG